MFFARRYFRFIVLFYRVPDFLFFHFKRSDIHIDVQPIFAFEIIWYLPQVPADAASAKLEAAQRKNLSSFVYNR